MCFAGVETKDHLDLMKRIGQKYILMSYFYLRKKFNEKDRDLLKEYCDSFELVLIDSGAFTFLTNEKVFEGINSDSKEDFDARIRIVDQYVNKYTEFLTDIKPHVDACFEMDWENGAGSKKCWDWYDVIASSGVPTMPVYHGDMYKRTSDWVEDTPEIFRQWCQKYPYIAIGSTYFNESARRVQLQTLFRYAKEFKTKVHGLGATGYTYVRDLPAFSVDSTSWLAGAQYGVTYLFANGKVRGYETKQKFTVRRRVKHQCEKYGIDWKKLMDDDSKEVSVWNAYQWKLFVDAIEDQHKRRKLCYWENGVEMEKDIEEELPIDIEEGDFIDEGGFIAQDVAEEEEGKVLVPVTIETGRYENRPMLVNPTILAHPRLCDTCYLNDRCSYFKEGGTCELNIQVNIGDAKDVVNVLTTLLEVQSERVIMGAHIEKMEGGSLNPEIGKEIGNTFKLANQLKEFMDTRETLDVKVKGHGILEKIFGVKDEEK